MKYLRSPFVLVRLPLLATCLLFVAAAEMRLRALQVSPYPTGIDGYWYLIQVRSLLERGHLYYPSAPLVPWLMAGAAMWLGPVLAVKVIAAFGSAALVVPSYAVARQVSGERWPALLGAALVATSAQSFMLCTEFVKQAVGLTLAVGFAAVLVAAIERPGKTRMAGAALLFVLCGLAHKTAIGLAVLLAAGPVLARLWSSHRRAAMLAGLAAIATAALALVRSERSLFHRHLDLTFAALAPSGGVPLVLGYEVALAAGLAIIALALAALRRPTSSPPLPALAVGFICFAILQALPWLDIADDQGLGYRLRLCACVCLAPCAALVAARLTDWVRPATRAALLAPVICTVLILRPWHSEEGVIHAHPAMVEATERLAGLLPPESIVVIPERHTAFMATWYGRVNTRLRPPPMIDPSRTYRLLPGAAIRPGLWASLERLRSNPIAGVTPSIDLHSLHPNGLVLLAERTFQYLVSNLPETERQGYQDWPVH